MPLPVGAFEEGDRLVGAAGQVGRDVARVGHVGVLRHAAVPEEGAGAVGEAGRAEMDQTPRDGGQRRRGRLRPLPVEVPAAVVTAAQAPAAVDRLPEVLLVGQAVQPWP